MLTELIVFPSNAACIKCYSVKGPKNASGHFVSWSSKQIQWKFLVSSSSDTALQTCHNLLYYSNMSFRKKLLTLSAWTDWPVCCMWCHYTVGWNLILCCLAKLARGVLALEPAFYHCPLLKGCGWGCILGWILHCFLHLFPQKFFLCMATAYLGSNKFLYITSFSCITHINK